MPTPRIQSLAALAALALSLAPIDANPQTNPQPTAPANPAAPTANPTPSAGSAPTANPTASAGSASTSNPNASAGSTGSTASVSVASADSPAVAGGGARPRVCLVLGGGGARGGAHVGVLKVLEEMRVPVDCIVGTSMGAIVGGLYASGLSARDLEEALGDIDWADAFAAQAPRTETSFRRKRLDLRYLGGLEIGVGRGGVKLPPGVAGTQQVGLLLRVLTLPSTGVSDFDRLPIPFRAVATDVRTGEMIVMRRGDLATAIRASMSVPGAFAPVEWEGRRLVDGGVVRNLPVDVAREMGADVVIAVDVGSRLEEDGGGASALQVSGRVLTMLTRANSDAQIAALDTLSDDVLIVPQLGKLGGSDFARILETVPLGEASARAHAAALARVAARRDSTYTAPSAGAQFPNRLRLDFLRVENESRLSSRVVLERLRLAERAEVDLFQLRDDIEALFGLGGFEEVSFTVERQGEFQGMALKVREKSWGPNYLRFGFGLQEDFRGGGTYDLAAALTLTRLNRRGGELLVEGQLGRLRRVFAEFYQPIDLEGRFFVAPSLEQRRTLRPTLEGGERVGEYRTSLWRLAAHAGARLDTWGEARVGFLLDRLDESPEVGGEDLPDVRVTRAGVEARVDVDRLDDAHFPTHGEFGTLRWQHLFNATDSIYGYDRLELDAGAVRSRGRNTLHVGLHMGSPLGSTVPESDHFELGGFMNLSGLPRRGVAGPYLAFGRLAYWRRLSDAPGSLRVGGSLETGGAWLHGRDATLSSMRVGGSVHAGLPTLLGPLWLAYGRTDGGNGSLYLFVGRAF